VGVEVTILVADDHIAAIDDVAAALRSAGLQLGQTLPETGVITGSVADAAAMETLAAVPGVAAVEPVQEIFIPPPDAPVQ
jgi:CheY-like chemotaxis protein